MPELRAALSYPAGLILLMALFALPAHAATAAEQPSKKVEGQDVDIEGIKKKYWVEGQDTRLSVVQDRQYTKEGRLELGAFGGFLSGDPFYDVKDLGGEISY